ncbi:MAG: hypothetical protein Ta2A_19270 [Treponemataceae bacterium]|nr:MAG: hypothetical protein Ta2A_19270 [Treponemataceae bacterium]
MEIITESLGNIILDTSKKYLDVFYKIDGKGYRDRNKGSIFFHFENGNEKLVDFYKKIKNKIIKTVDEYDYIKEILETYIINNFFDDKEVLSCLGSVLDYKLIYEIIDYLKNKINNLVIEILSDGPVIPDIKLFLNDKVVLFNEIKSYIIKNFGNDIIISYNNMFCPPDLTISINQEELKIRVLYEVEKYSYNSSMSFSLDKKYNVIKSFFDYAEPGK